MPKFPPVDVDIVVPATLVVAASDSLDPSRADYQCDGVNDEAEINQALNALPATGGEVKLLDGTYNCEATINLDSNQTLRGCGRNTILTTSTANLIFLSAVGGAGTEKTGIVIADLQIDGGAGAISDCGIYFKYTDYSIIEKIYSRRHSSNTSSYGAGIYLETSDFNAIKNNICHANEYYGIRLSTSTGNILSGNTCYENGFHGISLFSNSNYNIINSNVCQKNSSNGIATSSSQGNVISDNTCNENTITGIYTSSEKDFVIANNSCYFNTFQGINLIASIRGVVIGNSCWRNRDHGIYLSSSSNHNAVVGNVATQNSQDITNSFDDICLEDSDYNNIQGNTCRAGALANKPRYGINISNAACDGNLVTNNDLYNDGFGTGSFNNSGTGTVTAAGNRV